MKAKCELLYLYLPLDAHPLQSIVFLTRLYTKGPCLHLVIDGNISAFNTSSIEL